MAGSSSFVQVKSFSYHELLLSLNYIVSLSLTPLLDSALRKEEHTLLAEHTLPRKITGLKKKLCSVSPWTEAIKNI